MIARGTTPIIRMTFTIVDASSIDVAYLTIIQGDLLIEKTLEDATVVHTETDNYLEWHLTQDETLSLNASANAQIQCRYKANGVAYDSPVYTESIYRILKEGVI